MRPREWDADSELADLVRRYGIVCGPDCSCRGTRPPESPEVLAELARRVRSGLDEWWAEQDADDEFHPLAHDEHDYRDDR